MNKTLKQVGLAKIEEGKIVKDLVEFEASLAVMHHKVGVLYCKAGQTENQVFSNKHDEASPSFHEFLSFLGEEINLKNWNGFLGGLMKDGSTGEYFPFPFQVT